MATRAGVIIDDLTHQLIEAKKRIVDLEATLAIILKGVRLPSPKEVGIAKAMGASVGLIATPGAVAGLVALKAADEVIVEQAARDAKGGE